MKKIFKSFLIGLSFIAGLRAAEQSVDVKGGNVDPFSCLPAEILYQILPYGNGNKILELGSEVSFETVFGDFWRLRQVCTGLKNIVDHHVAPDKEETISCTQKKKDFWKKALVSAYKTIGYGEVCEIFLNGVLRYTSDEGVTYFDLFIADLAMPFSGEFNLSKFGDAGSFLSVGTGYRKESRNIAKVEMYFCPWFIMKRDIAIQEEAHSNYRNIWDFWESNYSDIWDFWESNKAPVGVFISWGRWNNLGWFSYLVNENLDGLSKQNLLTLSNKARARYPFYVTTHMYDDDYVDSSPGGAVVFPPIIYRTREKFHIHFEQK